jgi:hypothetical protein
MPVSPLAPYDAGAFGCGEDNVRSFKEQLRERQVAWRRSDLENQEPGYQNGKSYPHVLPRKLWEMNLWPGIRTGSALPLPEYLIARPADPIQAHTGVHNLLSSWVACANLYFPFRREPYRPILAEFLRATVSDRILSVTGVELEFALDGELHPCELLGESGGSRGSGQTSPDVAFRVEVENGKQGLVLVECKLTEHSFYRCSARTKTGSEQRPGNPDPSRCTDMPRLLADPEAVCHQRVWSRRYWEHLRPVTDTSRLSELSECPASTAGYQLFRQQALAEGIAASGKYGLVVSCVAYDRRNEGLMGCLGHAGMDDIRVDWPKLFPGAAMFTTFTHQEWVEWVRQQSRSSELDDWLSYVGRRYGY